MENSTITSPTINNNKAKLNNKSGFKKFIFGFNKNKTLLMLTLPMVIYIFIFNYIPMFGVIIAFKDFKYNLGFLGSRWVGFKNFEFFFKSPDAWRITRNTLGYNATFIIIDLIAAVAIALLLYEIRNRGLLKTYQTVMFIPHFLSWIVVAYMVNAFLNPSYGMLVKIMEYIGVQKVDWYTTPFYWIFIFPIAQVWKTIGFSALIYYASLLSIDTEYFEAAAIEGANKWQIMTKIKIPFLIPLMTILTILAIGRIFNSDFGLFYQVPMNSTMLYPATDVIETYVFRALTQNGNIGMSSAAGLYKSFVGFVLVIITNATVKKINPENSLY